MPCISGQQTTNTTGNKEETVEEGEETDIGREEKAEAEEYRDAETKLLIREYQKKANLTPATLKILEFYGGDKWRIDEGIEMRRCIQHLIDELEQQYQRSLRPDKETSTVMESSRGTTWREDTGDEVKKNILPGNKGRMEEFET